MTRRLILMRHAKSSWKHPGLDDHARPLNGRGRRSATALGAWLRSKGLAPDHILSSSSMRTRETCIGLGFSCDMSFLDGLYHAGPDQMLQVLRGAGRNCVLMLGHNPGIAWLAGQLVSAPPDHPRFHDYPTCATLVVEFPIDDWRNLRVGTGQVMHFITPRELVE